MSLGRALRPSLVTPRAMAPLETTTTRRASSSSADATSAASRSQASFARLFDPIFTMTRRDRPSAARMAARSPARLPGGGRSEERRPSCIEEIRARGGNVVERHLEAPLDVAREGCTGQEEHVDPARELVAQVLGAGGDLERAGGERRHERALRRPIDR